MKEEALIVWGGWEGHEPEAVGEFFCGLLEAEGFQVRLTHSRNAFLQCADWPDLKLIVPVITMSTIEPEQCAAVRTAVADRGVGLAGCHGGMCDAFRNDTDWQFMTGGQWVAHPGDDKVTYQVNIADCNHPITAGLNDFEVTSEQYFLHTDPGNHVLATTQFPHPGVDGPHSANPCAMPQIWTKHYGKGRVFYNALGHRRADLEAETPREIMRRGLLWAAQKLGTT